MISRMLNRRRFLGYGLGIGGAVLTGGLASNLTGCQKASETSTSAAASAPTASQGGKVVMSITGRSISLTKCLKILPQRQVSTLFIAPLILTKPCMPSSN